MDLGVTIHNIYKSICFRSGASGIIFIFLLIRPFPKNNRNLCPLSATVWQFLTQIAFFLKTFEQRRLNGHNGWWRLLITIIGFRSKCQIFQEHLITQSSQIYSYISLAAILIFSMPIYSIPESLAHSFNFENFRKYKNRLKSRAFIWMIDAYASIIKWAIIK